MKHQKTMKQLLHVMLESDTFHCTIFQSPPGWGKSTVLNEALTEMGIDAVYAGSYNTPLSFYNNMALNPDKVIVLDDCSGLFDNLVAMACLKAATWPNTKTGTRDVKYDSTSDRVIRPEGFAFKGKLILMTNVFPQGRDCDAFKSRALFYQMHFTKEQIAKMLLSAAKNKHYYSNQKRASAVAKFMIKSMDTRDYSKYSLRDLERGYEFATKHPNGWRDLLENVLPELAPQEVVRNLADSKSPVVNQLHDFQRMTGASARTFYRLRADLGLANIHEQERGRVNRMGH